MKRPDISIIIPVYNAEQNITTLVNQITSQKFQGIEVILINDGSRDSSGEKCKKLSKQDHRVRYFNKTNGGTSSARNIGLSKARGEFMMFFDADDEITPSMITKMFDEISKNTMDVVSCGVKLNKISAGKTISSVNIDINPEPKQNNGESFKEYFTRLLGIDGRLYNVTNKIYRTKIIRENQLTFRENLSFGEDLTFNLDFLQHTDKLELILEPLYIYKQDVEKGTYSHNATDLDSWKSNFHDVVKFLGKENEETNWIKNRWLFSYIFAISAIKNDSSFKISKLELLGTESPRPYKGASWQRRILSQLLILLHKSPHSLLVLGTIANLVK